MNVPSLGDLPHRLELEVVLDGLDKELGAVTLDSRRMVLVLGEERILSVGEVGGLDGDGLDGPPGGRRVDGGSGEGSVRGGGSRGAVAVDRRRVVDCDGSHGCGVGRLTGWVGALIRTSGGIHREQ
jgi:hypothetical protein